MKIELINEINFENALMLERMQEVIMGAVAYVAPLAELEGEYPDVKFCKINVDNDPELAKAFNVKNIPMVAFVKDNTFADMSIGFVPKENLKKLIEENK